MNSTRAYFFLAPFKPTWLSLRLWTGVFAILVVSAALAVQGQVTYTSIDTMKKSRDREATYLITTNEINQIVQLCATLPVTHITIDANFEYTNIIQEWVTAIRATGKSIYWRSAPNQWQDNNGTTGIMSTTNYNIAMAAFITNNPGFFASGDIYDPCSEAEGGNYWTNKYGVNVNWNNSTPPGANVEYNKFLLWSTAAANSAFSVIGISGVNTTVHSMDSWMAENVLSNSTASALSNHVCIDSYPEGTNTNPSTCASLRLSELQTLTNRFPAATILIGESGYCNSAGVSDTTQSNVLAAEFTMYEGQHYVGGFNYWVGPGSATEGGYTYVMETNGTFVNGVEFWVPRPGCFALSNFFNVVLPPTPNPISINFSGTGGTGTNMAASEAAGVILVSNWNNFVGLSANNQSLVDSTGASTIAKFTFNDPKSFSATSIANTPGNYRMMKFYLDSSTNTTTTVTVTNLPADSNGFKVYVYFDGNNSETREGAYKISGAGITTTTIDGFDNANTDFSGTFTQANNNAGNYVVFTIGDVNAFNLSATAVNNGATYPRGPLNGIQIVPQ